MLFQSDIEILKSEITNFEAIIATRRTRIEQLSHAETVADGAIQSLQDAVAKFQQLAPDAIAALKTAVLGLFGGDDSSGGDDPDDPAPEPDTAPAVEGGEDAVEEAVQAAVAEEVEPSDRPYVVLVELNPTLAYQQKHSGEIVCAYLGCATSQLAKRWGDALELWGCRIEVRKPKRIADCRWEVKFWGADINRLNQLVEAHPGFSSPVPSPKPQSVEPFPKTSSANLTESESTGSPLESSVEFTFSETPDSCALTPDFLVYTGDREFLGKVRESLTLKGWLHKHANHNQPFPTREAAAADLYQRKIAQKEIHDASNARILAAHGF